MKIKNIFYASLFTVCTATVASSCSKGLEGINKSVDLVTDPNPDLQLPSIELSMLDRTYYTQGDFIAPMVGQVTQSKLYSSLVMPGGNHGYHFDWVYQNPLKSVVDVIEHTTDVPEKINYLSIGRIIRAYLIHQLTDVYGDIPYFEANKGYSGQLLSPKYDTQQDIYMDMLKELDEAAAALNAELPVPSASDIVYEGDVTKWRKFAYGLMFRLAVRIHNVDASASETWINKAIAGGLPESNDDNFVVHYMPSSYYGPTQNGQPHIMIRYFNNYRLTEPFISALKDHNDPRMPVYAMLPGSTSSYAEGDKTPENQKGYPMFGSIPEPKSGFSVSNIKTFGRYEAPYIHLSYSQMQFLLAECAAKGIIDGDDKAYYENGVRAAMEELQVYGAEGEISSDKIDEYLTNNPYAPANLDEALELINTQYWIETHYNWYETFANMRRTGYPKIYEKLNDGSVLPRRLTYPAGEVAINPNVQDAIQRQGPDVTSTRMWWDK